MSANYRQVIAAAKRALPIDEIEPSREHSRIRKHSQMLLVGIALDMSSPRPSLSEAAEALTVSKSSCHKWERCWRDIPWRERYGWMLLVEAQLRSTP